MLEEDLRPGAYRVGGPVRQTPGQPDPGRPNCAACRRTPWSGRGPAASARSTRASFPARLRPPHRDPV